MERLPGPVLLFSPDREIVEHLAMRFASIPATPERVVVRDEARFRAALRGERYGVIVVEDSALDLALALAPRTPVVAVVTQPDEDGSQALRRAGAAAVVQWPELRRLDELVAKLRRGDGNRETSAALRSDFRPLLPAAATGHEHLLSLLSHELRTPLMPILAATHLLEQQALPAPARELVPIIQRNAELEVRLVGELLDLAAIMNGSMAMAREPTGADECLRPAVERAAAEASRSGLQVELSFEAPRARVLACCDRLRQIVTHLLRNAVKFTPPGGTIRVATAATPDGEYRFEVQDTGIGIDVEAIERIFSAFEQGDNGITREYGGLGLGLAIARELTRRHGGSLGAHSEGPGRGARFTLRMPRLPDAVGPRDIRRRREPLAVLLVEDNRDTREAMQRLLRLRGYRVTAVGSLSDGLRQARDGLFDLLIGDLGLPDGDGAELARVFARAQRAPSIAITGLREDRLVDRCQAAGFTAHMSKPVNFERLNELMDVLTDG